MPRDAAPDPDVYRLGFSQKTWLATVWVRRRKKRRAYRRCSTVTGKFCVTPVAVRSRAAQDHGCDWFSAHRPGTRPYTRGASSCNILWHKVLTPLVPVALLQCPSIAYLPSSGIPGRYCLVRCPAGRPKPPRRLESPWRRGPLCPSVPCCLERTMGRRFQEHTRERHRQCGRTYRWP